MRRKLTSGLQYNARDGNRIGHNDFLHPYIGYAIASVEVVS